jgi:catechol 2,3-dioxygenase-like lactoylglutathione lyase family enzyme
VTQRLALVTLLVRGYDEAKVWYMEKLGFSFVEDTDLGGGRRWLVLSPGRGGADFLLAQAKNEAERAAIGNQAGGRVAFFLHTDDFARDHGAMIAQGVKFREPPRREAYGTVAVFEDLYGNLFDLIEMKIPPA